MAADSDDVVVELGPPHGSEIIITDLPGDTPEQDVRSLCEPFGDIYKVEVIIYNKCYHRPDCMSVVTYETKLAAEKAKVYLNHKDYRGRRLCCSLSTSSNLLFVGNIPNEMSESRFREIISKVGYGFVKLKKLESDPVNLPKKFAIVKYHNFACANYSKKKMLRRSFKLDGELPSVSGFDPEFHKPPYGEKKRKFVDEDQVSDDYGEDQVSDNYGEDQLSDDDDEDQVSDDCDEDQGSDDDHLKEEEASSRVIESMEKLSKVIDVPRNEKQVSVSVDEFNKMAGKRKFAVHANEDQVCDDDNVTYPGQKEKVEKTFGRVSKRMEELIKESDVPRNGKQVVSVDELSVSDDPGSDSDSYLEALRDVPPGQHVDREVVKKYLKQVKESEGFDVDVYPGPIEGITTIVPLLYLLEKRGRSSEYYKKIMRLAFLAVEDYNKKNGTLFKVLEIKKLTVSSCQTDDYYITFSVDGNGTAHHKTLQAIVSDDFIYKKREVVLCRDAK